MSGSWDYAKHSHVVKMEGGPEKYIATLKKFNFQEGVKKGIEIGKKQRNPIIGGALFVGIGLGVGGYKLYENINNKKMKDDDMITEEEVLEAEKQLLKELEEPINEDNLGNTKVETELECDNFKANDDVKLEEKENEEEK